MGFDYQTVTPYNEYIIEVIKQRGGDVCWYWHIKFKPCIPLPSNQHITPNHFKVSDPIAQDSMNMDA